MIQCSSVACAPASPQASNAWQMTPKSAAVSDRAGNPPSVIADGQAAARQTLAPAVTVSASNSRAACSMAGLLGIGYIVLVLVVKVLANDRHEMLQVM